MDALLHLTRNGRTRTTAPTITLQHRQLFSPCNPPKSGVISGNKNLRTVVAYSPECRRRGSPLGCSIDLRMAGARFLPATQIGSVPRLVLQAPNPLSKGATAARMPRWLASPVSGHRTTGLTVGTVLTISVTEFRNPELLETA